MTCKHCGQPIRKCQLPKAEKGCWYHIGHGWHRCDGKAISVPGAAPVAEPADGAE